MGEWQYKCRYLVALDGGLIRFTKTYKCELTGQEMTYDDPKVKFTCNADECYQYEKCPVYKQNR